MQVECSLCKKTYASKKNLLKHNRLKHTVFCVSKVRRKDDETNTYKCRFCDKEYSLYQSRWYHEKKCHEKDKCHEKHEQIVENALSINNEDILKENIMLKKRLIQLEDKLSNKSIEPMSFKAINNVLKERSFNAHNTTNNTINNNINTTNNINNITNNIQILGLGNEEMSRILTMTEKIEVLESRLGSIEKLVEIAHCGNYDQYKNVVITNMKDQYGYKYDEQKGFFVTVPKYDLLEDIIVNRLSDIEEMFDELKDTNHISSKSKKIITDLFERMEDTSEFVDQNTRFANFRAYKSNKVKMLLYNNNDVITRDLSKILQKNPETPITEEA